MKKERIVGDKTIGIFIRTTYVCAHFAYVHNKIFEHVMTLAFWFVFSIPNNHAVMILCSYSYYKYLICLHSIEVGCIHFSILDIHFGLE